MAYQVDTTKPRVVFDVLIAERKVAEALNANNITTQAQKDTAVANMTTASPAFLAAVKAWLDCFTVLPPT